MDGNAQSRIADCGLRIEPRSRSDPQSAIRNPQSKRSPWPIAVVIGLGIVIAFNAFYVYMALTNLDPIDPAYVTQPR
jgi:hypothetical protein